VALLLAGSVALSLLRPPAAAALVEEATGTKP